MNDSSRIFFYSSRLWRRVFGALVLVSILTSSLSVVAYERRVVSNGLSATSVGFERYGASVDRSGSNVSRYSVGVKEVRWTSRTGSSYSALAYYPTTPPADGGSFSAIIFSHGLGSSAENFSYLARSWARDGAVVLCLRHPGSDESVWRGKLRAMNELREAYQRYWTARDRAVAISSAIDFLYASHSSAGPMGADVDLARIGVAGNDLGALASLLVAGQLPPDNGVSLKDPRVAVVLALSPPVFCEANQSGVVYASVEAPTMVLTGTEDDGIVGTTKAYQRRIPFDGVSLNDRFLVVLQGGDHRVYAGHRMASKQAHDAPYQETIRVASTEFWRAYLNGDLLALNGMRFGSFTSKFSNASVEARFAPTATEAADMDAAAAQISGAMETGAPIDESALENMKVLPEASF